MIIIKEKLTAAGEGDNLFLKNILKRVLKDRRRLVIWLGYNIDILTQWISEARPLV
jgi:hypothetical protein